jgi:hypothetical protein
MMLRIIHFALVFACALYFLHWFTADIQKQVSPDTALLMGWLLVGWFINYGINTLK